MSFLDTYIASKNKKQSSLDRILSVSKPVLAKSNQITLNQAATPRPFGVPSFGAMQTSTPQFSTRPDIPGMLAQAVIQAPFKATGTLLASGEQLITRKPISFTPGVPFLQGNEPIPSIQQTFPQVQRDIASLGISNPIATAFAGAATLGGPILDLSFGGAGRKGAINAIVKATEFSEAAKIGRQIGISEDLLKQFSEGAVRADAPEKAQALVDSIANIQRTTKKSPPVFKGFDDLSTKLLNDLKGRASISKTYLTDATNRPDLKQAERDLFRTLLQDEPSTVNVADFAKKVRGELLPLKVSQSGTTGEKFMEPTARNKTYEEGGVIFDPATAFLGLLGLGLAKKAGVMAKGFKVGKLTDGEAKAVFRENIDRIQPITGKYAFSSVDDVRAFIAKEQGAPRFSNALNAPFRVNEATTEHFFGKWRPEQDYARRARLFGVGLEVLEDKGVLAGVDRVTGAKEGIVYYDILGTDGGDLIRAKISEQNKNGKVYFTVFDISGGAPVPATASSARRLGRLTTSETVPAIGRAPIPPYQSPKGESDGLGRVSILQRQKASSELPKPGGILAHSAKDAMNDIPSMHTPSSLQEARTELALLKDVLDTDPAKELIKYVSRTTGRLPEMTGNRGTTKSKFGLKGDDIYDNLGFKTDDEAQEAVDAYKHMQERVREIEAFIRESKAASIPLKPTAKGGGLLKPLIPPGGGKGVGQTNHLSASPQYNIPVQNRSTPYKWITSGEKILKKSGAGGVEMEKVMKAQRTDEDLLTGAYNVRIQRTLRGLSKGERLQVTHVLEGGKTANPKVQKAASELRVWLDEVAKKAEADKFEMRLPGGGSTPFKARENYFPRQYDLDGLAKGKRREEAIQHLIKTGQASDPAKAEELLELLINSAQRRAGNLENPRLADLPGYEKDPAKALPRYGQSVAKRFTEAEHFGKKDEKISTFINQIAKDRGDYQEAQRVFDFTVDGAPKNKVVSAITQFNVATKLSLSAIVNATQSINTATKAGILNTMRAVWRGSFKDGKELAELVNAYDDFIYVREGGFEPTKLVRGVMYIFKKVENFNRRTAANVGYLRAQQLAHTLRKDPESAYAIRQLESLGVDIGRAITGKLTERDLLTAANKMIEKTQFKVDPLDIPPSWKTPLGRLITQFKSFTFMQTKFVRDEIIKEAARGNLVPFVRFVTLAVPASLLVNAIRNKLTGRDDEHIDVRDWDKWMKAFGTIPTDLLIQADFLKDTFESDFLTPIEKGSRGAGSFLGPTAGEAGKLVAGLENIPRTEEKNKYLRKTGREQDPYVLLKRQGIEKIPFAGQYLKNTTYPFPKSTKTPEEKTKNKVMYDLIDELAKKSYEDASVRDRVIEYMKSLPDDEERKRQLFIMSEQGIKTSGISSSKAVLDFRPKYDRIQKIKATQGTPAADAEVNKLSDGDYKTYKRIRSADRAKRTEEFREKLSEDPKRAVQYLRAQSKEEQDRIINLVTPEEYERYQLGK